MRYHIHYNIIFTFLLQNCSRDLCYHLVNAVKLTQSIGEWSVRGAALAMGGVSGLIAGVRCARVRRIVSTWLLGKTAFPSSASLFVENKDKYHIDPCKYVKTIFSLYGLNTTP